MAVGGGSACLLNVVLAPSEPQIGARLAASPHQPQSGSLVLKIQQG